MIREKIKNIIDQKEMCNINNVYFFKLENRNETKIIPVVFNDNFTQFIDLSTKQAFDTYTDGIKLPKGTVDTFKSKVYDLYEIEPQKERVSVKDALFMVGDKLKDFYAQKSITLKNTTTGVFQSVSELCNELLVSYKSYLCDAIPNLCKAEEDTARYRKLSAYLNKYNTIRYTKNATAPTTNYTIKDICDFAKKTSKVFTKCADEAALSRRA